MSIDSIEYVDSRRIRIESLDTDIWFDIMMTRRQIITLRKRLETIVGFLDSTSFHFGRFPNYQIDNVPDSMKRKIQWLRSNPYFMMDVYYQQQLDEIYNSFDENQRVISEDMLIDVHHKYVKIKEYVDVVVEYYSWSLKYTQKKMKK